MVVREASMPEEPGAVILHAGIRAGGGRVTALPTATGCADENRQGVGGESPPRREAGRANHLDIESCAVAGNGGGEALTDERAGWVLRPGRPK